MATKAELEAQVGRLTALVEEMRGRMARIEGRGQEPASPAGPTSRRDLLRLGGAALVGAAGTVALRAIPAAATDGDTVHVGQTTTGEHPTVIKVDSSADAAIPTLAVESFGVDQTAVPAGTFSGPIQAYGLTTLPNPTVYAGPDGVDAWAGGSTAFAVYGLTDSGVGVVGESASGIGLYARASGRILQEPRNPTGTPDFAANNFEQIRDAGGVLWISGLLAGLQQWRRINTLRVDSAVARNHIFVPLRRIDTRNGSGAKSNGNITTYSIAGQGTGDSTIPTDAIAVVGNVTAVGNPTLPGGYLTVAPSGSLVITNGDTATSTANYITGAGATANAFVVGLSGGSLDLFTRASSGTVHHIIDITGYIQ